MNLLLNQSMATRGLNMQSRSAAPAVASASTPIFRSAVAQQYGREGSVHEPGEGNGLTRELRGGAKTGEVSEMNNASPRPRLEMHSRLPGQNRRDNSVEHHSTNVQSQRTTTSITSGRFTATDELAMGQKRSIEDATPEDDRPRKVNKQNGDHTAVTSSRRMHIYVFGDGEAGELGLGAKNATQVAVPRLNHNLEGVVSVATGGMHAVALTDANTVMTWGVNDEGALGRDTAWAGGLKQITDQVASDSDSDDGDLNPREAMPTSMNTDSVPKSARVVQIAAGDSTTFVLTDAGLVYGCGTFRNANGRYGFSVDQAGSIIDVQPTLALIRGLHDIVKIAVGADVAFALNRKGQVYSWGPAGKAPGDEIQLGRLIVARRPRSDALVPGLVAISRSRKIVSIHTGLDHAFAIDQKGDTWAWGLNNFAQTGILSGSGTSNAAIVTPQRVKSLAGRGIKTISGGRHHSIGLTQSGQCLVWGRLDAGQLGIDIAELDITDASQVAVDDRGKPRILLQPMPVKLPACVDVTCGPDHNIVITEDGEAFSWGFNVNYQCGHKDTDDIPIPKPIKSKAILDQKLCWTGAGGQYSMLGSYCALTG